MTEIKIIELLPTSTKEKALNPTSSLIGQAFSGLAHKVLDPLIKLNIVKEKEMEDFVEQINNKSNNIPEENRDSSKLGLAYKAFEDSTYQLDSETLRLFFANLIASTVDDRKNNSVKPSFSSILKDLTPEDANLFSTLHVERGVPVTTLRYINEKTHQGIDNFKNLILLESEIVNLPTSLDTLSRFGLIEIRPDRELIAEKYKQRYEEIKNSHYYKLMEQHLPINDTILLDKVEALSGSLALTDLGLEFGNIVLGN